MFVYLFGSHVAYLNKYLRWSCWFLLDGKRFNEAFTNIMKSSKSKRFQFENGPLFFFTLRILFFNRDRFFLDFSLHLTLDDIETTWLRLISFSSQLKFHTSKLMWSQERFQDYWIPGHMNWSAFQWRVLETHKKEKKLERTNCKQKKTQRIDKINI